MPSERPSYTEQVAQYFREHPGEWIDGRRLAEIGGCYAWRSRVSEARRSGMTIENRQRRRDDGCDCNVWTVSEYRYTPSQPESVSDQHNANQPFTVRAEAGRLGV